MITQTSGPREESAFTPCPHCSVPIKHKGRHFRKCHASATRASAPVPALKESRWTQCVSGAPTRLVQPDLVPQALPSKARVAKLVLIAVGAESVVCPLCRLPVDRERIWEHADRAHRASTDHWLLPDPEAKRVIKPKPRKQKHKRKAKAKAASLRAGANRSKKIKLAPKRGTERFDPKRAVFLQGGAVRSR
jgi:hypothetical protein